MSILCKNYNLFILLSSAYTSVKSNKS